MQILRKHKRRKALIALLFPAITLLFLVGWSLYWIGAQKQQRRAQPERPKEHVTLEAILFEELPEITS